MLLLPLDAQKERESAGGVVAAVILPMFYAAATPRRIVC